MDFVVSNFDKFVAKYSVMDNLFGIAITCLIIGLFLLLYYRKIEGYLFKPFKLLLQFCVNAFLIVGLIGVLIEGGFHIVNKFSGKSPQSDNSSSNIVSEVQNNYNTNNKTQKQTSNNQTISEAEEEKIYKLSINDLIALANDGNALAQYRLGVMYHWGNYVNKDEQKAFEWYKKAFEGFSKAAELGNAYAQYNLGFMYYYGKYVNKDYKKAYMWYYLAQLFGFDTSSQLNELTKSSLFSPGEVSYSEAREAQAEARRKYDEIKKRMNK